MKGVSLFKNRVRLNNGVEMPMIGYGSAFIEDEKLLEQCMKTYYQYGGRKIDTASMYKNEKQLGDVFKKLGFDRSSLFVNTKIWTDDMTYERALKSVAKSMEDLQVDYLDLVQIHWPTMDLKGRIEVYRAFEELYEQKKVRSIGVSNFYEEHLEHLFKNSTIKPQINQIEIHPGCFRRSIIDFCQKENIVLEAYSPFAHGWRSDILKNKTIVGIAEKHGKLPSQVVLRWMTQHGLVPLPRSKTPERVRDNVDIFNFELTQEELSAIDALTTDKKVVANYSDRLGGMKYDENSL